MNKHVKQNRTDNIKRVNKTKFADKQKSQPQNAEKKTHDNVFMKAEIIPISNSEFTNDERQLYDVLHISEVPENKFKNREIRSNWSKYEIPVVEDNSVVTDFENLMQTPISVGGHFKFKSEKIGQLDITNEYREYFSLNINRLAECLETLPFHKRHDLNENIFTSDEIKTMTSNHKTEECIKGISKILQKSPGNGLSKEHILKNVESSKPHQQTIIKKLNSIILGESSKVKFQHEDDLDDLLILKVPAHDNEDIEHNFDAILEPELRTTPKVSQINSRTHLENWLDDLLQ